MKDELSPKTFLSPYDLFGYLIPGLFTLGGLAFINPPVHVSLARLYHSGTFLDVAILSGIAYIAGHLIAAMSSVLIERLILQGFLGYPTRRFLSVQQKKVGIAKLSWCIGNFLLAGYFRSFTPQFQKELRSLFKEKFRFESDETHDLFWLASSYLSIHNQTAYRRAYHFVELYGFARNTCLSFLLLAVAPFLPGSIIPSHIPLTPFCWFILFFICSYFMFLNYTKFIRRLDEETYRSFVITSYEETKKSSQNTWSHR